MKKIKFCYKPHFNISTSEYTAEFDDDVTQQEINEAFEEWVWNEVCDKVWTEDIE
jgi:hypothetical protein